MKRDVQFVRAIDTAYETVRDRLRDEPAGVFGVDDGRIVVPLIARLRGTELHRDVEVEIIGFDEPAAAAGGAHLMFSADASKHADLFPHLEARLDAIPITDERTALFLVATYKPPLGVVGGAMNALGLHRFAEQSLGRLFEQIAERLDR